MSSVNFNNLDGVIEAIAEKANAADLEKALGKCCALVERSAKQNAPKGTGELRRSITSKVEEREGSLVGIVFTPLEYAPYVEYGTGLFAEGGNGRKDVPWNYQDDEGNWHSTSGMPPRPYLRPALNDNREEIMRLLGEALNND